MMPVTPRIEIWMLAVADIPAPVWPRLTDMLMAEERERAARFVFDRHRREHLAAHALKRLLLSDFDGRPPQAWEFETAPGGKPHIRGGSALHFNLSHSDGMVVCAASNVGELGVDVEAAGRNLPLEIAGQYFAAEEVAWLRSLAEAEQVLGFLRLWTLKEAFIKATGQGLAQPLHDFAFRFDPLNVVFHDPALGVAEDWRFDQYVMAGHVLALARRATAGIARVALSRMSFDDSAQGWGVTPWLREPGG